MRVVTYVRFPALLDLLSSVPASDHFAGTSPDALHQMGMRQASSLNRPRLSRYGLLRDPAKFGLKVGDRNRLLREAGIMAQPTKPHADAGPATAQNGAADVATRTRHKDDVAAYKRAAACAAVAEVKDGMLVGLGTGTTANFAITALWERVAAGLKVTTVATSLATGRIAEAAGLRVLPFDTFARLDIAVDGADELDMQLRAIKGKGGSLLREKIVAAAAERVIVIADAGKQVARLGRGPLPVEVLPFAAGFVTQRIERLGAAVSLRMAGDAGYRTDQDNVVLDCRFGAIEDPYALAAALSAIPGVLEHGLFLDEIDVAYVGGADGVTRLIRGAS
jgi:ribose 5-phosphate isomerase A